MSRTAAVREERQAWQIHRETLRGSSFPPARSRRPATFLHGFLLPFSLIATTLRHPTVGLRYVKLIVVRALVVGLVAALVFRTEHFDPKHAQGLQFSSNDTDDDRDPDEGNEHHVIRYSHTRTGADGKLHKVKGHVNGVHLDDGKVKVDTSEDDDTVEPTGDPYANAPWAVRAMKYGWAWAAWFVGIVSVIEGILIFVSRGWDDWVGHCASPLAGIRPEEPFPPNPKITLFELRWLWRKAKRRLRGYITVGSVIPLAMLFRLIPTVGDALFALGVTAWSWYWIAVFTAAKTAHAWVDEKTAPPPFLIRELRDRSADKRYLRPIHLYARIWSRITQGLHAPAAVFERNPRPMLGLALARAILWLPGLYLVAHPIIPVAAGRLIAESDPADRFSASSPSP